MHSHCFGLHILQSESKLLCNDDAWKQHKCKGKQQNFCKARKFCEAPYSNNVTFFKLGFTAYKAEQPLQGIELQEKESQKD